jgi:hypothetical protein
MKLTEIFDVEKGADLSTDTDEQLGKGMYASVHSSKTDPHMVNKFSISYTTKVTSVKFILFMDIY